MCYELVAASWREALQLNLNLNFSSTNVLRNLKSMKVNYARDSLKWEHANVTRESSRVASSSCHQLIYQRTTNRTPYSKASREVFEILGDYSWKYSIAWNTYQESSSNYECGISHAYENLSRRGRHVERPHSRSTMKAVCTRKYVTLSISEIESASDTYRHRHSLMYNHCMIVAWLLVITKGLQSKDLDHDGLNETLIDIVSK